jgi:hypothetical protein
VRKVKRKASFTPHSKTTPFWAPKLQHPLSPKRRRFGHFFFKKNFRRKIFEKKEEENWDWLEPPPRSVWRWSNHPHGQGGGPATPRSPQKKKKEWVLVFWGWLDHPQGLGGVMQPDKAEANKTVQEER